MATCKDCIYYDVCEMWARNIEEYNITLTLCENFKNKADVVEVPSDMIIFTQGKWLILNMESEQLGEAIKSCVDYLTKNAQRKEVD